MQRCAACQELLDAGYPAPEPYMMTYEAVMRVANRMVMPGSCTGNQVKDRGDSSPNGVYDVSCGITNTRRGGVRINRRCIKCVCPVVWIQPEIEEGTWFDCRTSNHPMGDTREQIIRHFNATMHYARASASVRREEWWHPEAQIRRDP